MVSKCSEDDNCIVADDPVEMPWMMCTRSVNVIRLFRIHQFVKILWCMDGLEEESTVEGGDFPIGKRLILKASEEQPIPSRRGSSKSHCSSAYLLMLLMSMDRPIPDFSHIKTC